MVNRRVPNTWRLVLLDNLTLPQKGKKPRKLSKKEFEKSVPYLDIKAIERGAIRNYADIESSVLAEKKDILIVWDGARSGWVGTSVTGAVGSTLMKLRPILIDSKYIFYFLRSKFDFINSQTKGIGIPHVNQDIFWNLKIPLSPLKEQKRISSKLDTLFKNINSIQSRLDEFPNIISELRQQILYQAITGQFTKDWRVKNGVKKRWQNVKLKDHSIKIGSGATPRGGQSVYITKGIPLIRSMNVHFKGFKYDGLVFINKKQADELKNVTVKSGDVLLNITGASIGRVCQAPSNMNGARVNQHVCIIRTKNTIVQSFLNYFLASPKMQQYIDSENYGVTRQALTKIMIEDFEIPLPGKKEQNEIVKRIRKIFNQINKIESKHNSLLTFIEEFRNSVLESAYTGKLVPQNPKDEPIEKLLERIKKEKEKLVQQKRIANTTLQQKRKANKVKSKKGLKLEFGLKILIRHY